MGRYLRGTAVYTARTITVVLAIVMLTSAATGWLYWVRPAVAGWPGPRIADAMPLDELPGTDGIPLIIYVGVFAIAGLILGLVARTVRLDRLTAAWLLAAGTGGWLLAVDTFCIFVVRQVPSGAALRTAAGLQPVYIAAALAGAGGALLGRNERATGIPSRLLAWLVAAGGLIDVASAAFPRPGPTLGALEKLLPGAVMPATHILLVPVGVLLLITSSGLARRNRRAWRLAVAMLSMSVLLQFLRGPDYAAAITTGLVAVALVARRDYFAHRGDPAAQPSALLRLSGMLVFALLYGVTTLWAYRTSSDLPFSLFAALRDTLAAMIGRMPGDVDFLPGEFAEWFPLSVLSIVVIAVIWAGAVWIRPWRHRLLADNRRRAQAAEIVRQWGSDTLAPFALRSDKEWFVTGRTLIAYRVVRGIALVSGDPIGPPDEAEASLRTFLAHASGRGWRTAVMGASGRLLDVYRSMGFRPVYHGDEAVIDTACFALDGRPMRTVRQAVHRLERNGFRAGVVMAGNMSAALRAELTAVGNRWLGGGARKGFTMELDSLFRLTGDDALFVIGRDPHGRIVGFLHLAACPASQSLSLSTMPRLRDAPNGFTAWLIVQAAEWARGHGFASLSLNFAPFAGLLGAQTELPSGRRLERRLLLRLKKVLDLQLDNLLQFNGQFAPAWLPRYVILQAWTDLPRVVVAAMAAEGYLPYASLILGRGWAPSPVPGQAARRQDAVEAGSPARHPADDTSERSRGSRSAATSGQR